MNNGTPALVASEAIQPGRLWSLWEMQDFQATALFELCKEIGRIVQQNRGGKQDAPLSQYDRDINAGVMADHAKTFFDLSLPMCAMLASRISEASKTELKVGEWNKLLDELFSRMADECSLINVLSLTPTETALFTPASPLFGLEVESKYPSATYEIDEAAKCLALGRSTASVFHLMRVLEIGIRALARCLSIPDPVKAAEKNWGIILNKIWDDGISLKWASAADKLKLEAVYFTALYASLDAVKNPWRNATMHVENKYTTEEAEHIFSAVKGFMRKLASRMDENGDPKA